MEKINRVSLRLLKNTKDLVGVEIGFNEGVNAENIIENLDIQKLYVIDPYESYTHFKQENIDRWKEKGLLILEKYKDKIILIEKKSVDAIDLIPDNLDFVYIDGDHEYSSVFCDLMSYTNKIKKGGLLCGDNFECMTVRCAIYDFIVFERKDLLLDGIEDNIDKSIDWWIWKR